MSWYVLQVRTGEEDRTAQRIGQRDTEGFVPHERRVIRSRGSWTERDYVLMPGYVFVNVENSIRLFFAIHGVPGIIRVLGTKHPQPLTPDEEAYWTNDWYPSEVALDAAGHYEVISGPLARLADRIVKINRRQRRALIELELLGRKQMVSLSVQLTDFKGPSPTFATNAVGPCPVDSSRQGSRL